MGVPEVPHAQRLERTCAVVAYALSGGRRRAARLMSGGSRAFGTNASNTVVYVPYPPLEADWTRRTLTCGVALQCSPSKDRLANHALHELSPRVLGALTIVEGEVALGWVANRWPGLLPELERALPGMRTNRDEIDVPEMIERAQKLARSGRELRTPALIGRLLLTEPPRRSILARLRQTYAQIPWSSRHPLSKAPHTIPAGGDGGARNANPPPPSRPEDDDPEIRADQRAGIPYPEWNIWTQRFLPDHVAVLERRTDRRARPATSASPDLRRWFEEHTHRAMKNRLEDGCDLDIDGYVDHHVDAIAGHVADALVFRDLLPAARDVTTALLLDGSASLGLSQGRIFQLELACADALCRAMARARERHGLFVFSGNTRHRVDVTCLKDFDDRRLVVPSALGLTADGYTRLGAPLRHLTRRLRDQRSERRLLIVVGDGLMSDEGYEGRYAWGDVRHAVGEADDAGVSIYYIGVGPSRVDPLPEVFGPRRSRRIRRVEELPRVLAHVHRELVAA